jgi:hypothetical protein
MAQRDGGIENLAHAYRVLDARWEASPRANFYWRGVVHFPGEGQL